MPFRFSVASIANIISSSIHSMESEKSPKPREYTGVADFLLNAPLEEQIRAFTKAAQKSNEDQMKVFEAAQLKIKARQQKTPPKRSLLRE